MLTFNKPTLVTLTAPTCSGKSVLLNALADSGHPRIVSTTTRDPRVGETQGVDYYYIGRLESELLEARGEFAELVTYKGVRYGVTHQEMEGKMSAGKLAPVVILTPHGIEIYKKYCASKGWNLFTIYVHTPQSVCLERLNRRTCGELTMLSGNGSKADSILSIHTSRVKAILQDESHWITQERWDCITTGEDGAKALDDLKIAVEWRNRRTV